MKYIKTFLLTVEDDIPEDELKRADMLSDEQIAEVISEKWNDED